MKSILALAAYDPFLAGGEGWVGRWSPGIGDPTLLGWMTVVAYFAATFVCFRLRGRFSGNADALRRKERSFWTAMAGVLLFLGINKQMDLQTAMTEILRVLAMRQGWYEGRRTLQVAFIAVMAAALPVAAVVLFRIFRRLPAASKLAGLGLVVIAAFVLVRAASFHHVDRLLGATLLHFRLNWILELGGIAIVWVGAGRRRRQLNQGPHAR